MNPLTFTLPLGNKALPFEGETVKEAFNVGFHSVKSKFKNTLNWKGDQLISVVVSEKEPD